MSVAFNRLCWCNHKRECRLDVVCPCSLKCIVCEVPDHFKSSYHTNSKETLERTLDTNVATRALEQRHSRVVYLCFLVMETGSLHSSAPQRCEFVSMSQLDPSASANGKHKSRFVRSFSARQLNLLVRRLIRPCFLESGFVHLGDKLWNHDILKLFRPELRGLNE